MYLVVTHNPDAIEFHVAGVIHAVVAKHRHQAGTTGLDERRFDCAIIGGEEVSPYKNKEPLWEQWQRMPDGAHRS
jgi:hypothetical protein